MGRAIICSYFIQSLGPEYFTWSKDPDSIINFSFLMVTTGKLVAEEEFETLRNYITENKYPDSYTAQEKSALRKKADKYSIEENVLYYKIKNIKKRVLFDFRPNEKISLLNMIHKESHCGQEKFFKKIQQSFVGVSREDCRDIVKNCMICSSFKPLKTKANVLSLTFNKPWEHVQADCIDLRKYKDQNDEYSWILTIIDCYSKFAFAYKLKQKSMIEVLESFKNLFYREGMPQTLHTDNGKEFKNGEIKEFCRSNNIKMVHGRVRHPQTQGTVERFNQTICNRLATQLHNKDSKRWFDIIEKVVFEYNNEWHRAIDDLPFLIFRGRKGQNEMNANGPDRSLVLLNSSEADFESESLEGFPHPLSDINNTPSDGHDTGVKVNIIQLPLVNESYRTKYVSTFASNEYKEEFKIGDEVLIKKDFDNNSKTKKQKFSSFYSENGKIVGILNSSFYQIENDKGISVKAVNQMKKKHQ